MKLCSLPYDIIVASQCADCDVHAGHGRHLKVLICELLAIDRLATGAIALGEVATLASKS